MIGKARVATAFALVAVPLAVVVAPAQAEPATVPFQVQTWVIADLPTPRIEATVGVTPGAATLTAANPNPTANASAGPIGVRWFSLGTGAAGYAAFPAGQPAPVDIRPGAGQVVAVIEGGAFPGFGTFYVP